MVRTPKHDRYVLWVQAIYLHVLVFLWGQKRNWRWAPNPKRLVCRCHVCWCQMPSRKIPGSWSVLIPFYSVSIPIIFHHIYIYISWYSVLFHDISSSFSHLHPQCFSKKGLGHPGPGPRPPPPIIKMPPTTVNPEMALVTDIRGLWRAGTTCRGRTDEWRTENVDEIQHGGFHPV